MAHTTHNMAHTSLRRLVDLEVDTPSRLVSNLPRLTHNVPMAREPNQSTDSLAKDVADGRMVALARAITVIESGGSEAIALLDALHAQKSAKRANPSTDSPARIGITGPPGTGKSTLVARLVAHRRNLRPSSKIAVVAVDPSSPFSGGALLGDRYRMGAVADDPGVFIRSMASRGALGGLSEATDGACDAVECAGFGEIFVETVGVGQNEVAIASSCETTLVVLNPENGDSVQALKAGLLEVADIVVVNKADHPRTERFLNDLTSGLELQERQHGGWVTPVLTTVATEDTGTEAVMAAIDRHHAWLGSGGEGEQRRRQRALARVRRLWLAMLRDAALADPGLSSELTRLADAILAGRTSPHAAATALYARTVSGLAGS